MSLKVNRTFHRKSVRLSWYDYSIEGCYFITICSYRRENIFGDVIQEKMNPNRIGNSVSAIWHTLGSHHNAKLEMFQLMPNHMHGIIKIFPGNGRGIARNAPTQIDVPKKTDAPTPSNVLRNRTFGNVTAGSLPCIIRSIKSECTKQVRLLLENQDYVVWQRGYHEHIIRDENELQRIKEYIRDNPANWKSDTNFAP